MSQMQTAAAFQGAGIQDLSVDEVEIVAGGPLPAFVVPVVVGLIAAGAGYVTAKSTDDCTTTTTTRTSTNAMGETVTRTTSRTVCT